MSAITCRAGIHLDRGAVIELYRASALGERRPVDDRERMAAMLRNANSRIGFTRHPQAWQLPQDASLKR